MAVLLWCSGIHPMLGPAMVLALLGAMLPVHWLRRMFEKRIGTIHSDKVMGVHLIDEFTIAVPLDDAFKICWQAVLNLSFAWRFQKDQANLCITFQSKMTMKSFGEKVSLSLSQVDSNLTRVIVSSKPVISTTLIDYGKNAKNIQLLSAKLREAEKNYLEYRHIT